MANHDDTLDGLVGTQRIAFMHLSALAAELLAHPERLAEEGIGFDEYGGIAIVKRDTTPTTWPK